MAASLVAEIPRGWRIAWLVPFALGVLACFALQREPASLIAPLFGPWAGLLYGHRECTMTDEINREEREERNGGVSGYDGPVRRQARSEGMLQAAFSRRSLTALH